MSRVYLSLGSNLEDRSANLSAALLQIGELTATQVLNVSGVYETDPVGVTDQPCFLNLAAEIETALAPLEFLNACKEIETHIGRVATRRWGPRAIDIDLILWGTMVLESAELSLPHLRYRERNFVLAPLAEIAPEVMDPVTGRSVLELARQCQATDAVRRLPDIL